VNDSFKESPEEFSSIGEVGWSTMTGVVDADIILECRIDESVGDSGEIDIEERRSGPTKFALVGIGEDAAELEYSDDRWRGYFFDHLRSPLDLKSRGAYNDLLRPPTRVSTGTSTNHRYTNPKSIPRPLYLKRKFDPKVKRQQVDEMDRVRNRSVDILRGIP
jgi:hypothetical protein